MKLAPDSKRMYRFTFEYWIKLKIPKGSKVKTGFQIFQQLSGTFHASTYTHLKELRSHGEI